MGIMQRPRLPAAPYHLVGVPLLELRISSRVIPRGEMPAGQVELLPGRRKESTEPKPEGRPVAAGHGIFRRVTVWELDAPRRGRSPW